MENLTTAGGVEFREGELAIVIEARLAPVGCASVRVCSLSALPASGEAGAGARGRSGLDEDHERL